MAWRWIWVFGFSVLFVGFSSLPEHAWAQTKPVSVKKGKRTKDAPLIGAPTRIGQSAQPNRAIGKKVRACMERRDILEQAKDRLGFESSNVTSIDAEIAELQARLAYLKREKRKSAAREANQRVRVRNLQVAYDKECKGGDTCERKEKRVEALERRAGPLEAELSDLGRGIRESRVRIGKLRSEIRILRDDYNRYRCDNMVPGQTSQTTIDRCADIFSKWNKSQQELDRYGRSLTTMRTRYQRIKSRLDAITSAQNQAETYLARHCAESPARATIRTRRTSVQRAAGLFKELEAMSKDLDDARSITILR